MKYDFERGDIVQITVYDSSSWFPPFIRDYYEKDGKFEVLDFDSDCRLYLITTNSNASYIQKYNRKLWQINLKNDIDMLIEKICMHHYHFDIPDEVF